MFTGDLMVYAQIELMRMHHAYLPSPKPRHTHQSHRYHVMGKQVHNCMEKHLTCKYEGRLYARNFKYCVLPSIPRLDFTLVMQKTANARRTTLTGLGFSLRTAEITLCPVSCCLGILKHKNVSRTFISGI